MRIKKNGFTLNIFHDDIESPREYYKEDNISNMISFSKKYQIGDEHDFKNINDFRKWYKQNKEKVAIILPLFLYDHSGISISTKDFKDPWDSGQIGYIYVLSDLANSKGYENTAEIKSKIEDEIYEYDKWLSGCPEYFSYEIIGPNDELIESAGVFELNNLKSMLSEMKNTLTNKEYEFLFDKLYQNENENFL